MSQALRKLTAIVSKSNCIVLFINQLREKVGVMFGNPETTTGGRALKFYASVRLDVRKGETLKQGGVMVGNHTKVKVAKNKVAPPFKKAEFDIMFGEGISREGDILDLAVETKVVIKSGAWYSYNGEKIGQGRENVKKYLQEHADVCQEIEKKVRAEYSLGEEKPDKDKEEKAEKQAKGSKKKGAKKEEEQSPAEGAQEERQPDVLEEETQETPEPVDLELSDADADPSAEAASDEELEYMQDEDMMEEDEDVLELEDDAEMTGLEDDENTANAE